MSSTPNPPGSLQPGGFDSQTRRPDSRFSVGNVPAPTDLYCTDDSFLRITAFAFIAGVQVRIDSFILRSDDGQITTSEDVLNAPNAGALVTKDIPLIEGFLMGVTIIDSTGNNVRGNVFITAQIMRGTSTNNRTVRLLFADYVVGNQPIGYPFSRTTQSIDGRGAIVFQVGGAAGAGNETGFGLTAPGQRLSVHCASLTFVASAAVANRVPEFRLIRNGANIVWRMPYPGNITAGQTINITLMAGGPSPVVVGTTAILPLPVPTILIPADSIQTVTAGLQAGDQYTITNMSGEAWVNG